MNHASSVSTDFPRQPNYLSQTTEALRLWNASSTSNWHLKTMYLEEARGWLPGCATREEMEYVRLERLVDCSAEGDPPFETACDGTCGSILSLLYIPIWIFVAQCAIVNLVVAVLIVKMRALGKRVGRTGMAYLYVCV